MKHYPSLLKPCLVSLNPNRGTSSLLSERPQFRNLQTVKLSSSSNYNLRTPQLHSLSPVNNLVYYYYYWLLTEKMPVRIRLARFGCKNKPFYRVMAADSRSPRDGKHLEVLGYYNPLPGTVLWVTFILKWMLNFFGIFVIWLTTKLTYLYNFFMPFNKD